MSNDIRSRYTKETIERVVVDLLQEKPVEKITVTEVCKIAQINRSTFYKYYLDCYDVVEKLQQVAIDGLKGFLKIMQKENSDAESLIGSMLTYLRGHQDEIVFRARYYRTETFMEEIIKICFRNVIEMFNERDQSIPKDVVAFILSGSTGVISEWMYRDMTDDPREIAHNVCIYCDAVIKKAGG